MPLIGLLASSDDAHTQDGRFPILGQLHQLREVTEQYGVRRVYIALTLDEISHIEKLYIDLLDMSDGDRQKVLADEELAVTVHSNPHTGQAPVAQVIDGYVTPDLVFHGWDLARASGQDPELDEDYIAGAYAGMTGMADMIRGSGQFGVQQDVPADASVVEKFFAFIGRDPRWTP